MSKTLIVGVLLSMILGVSSLFTSCTAISCVFRSKRATLSEQTGRPFGAK